MNIKILMGMSSYFLSTLPLFSLCREIPHPTAGGALLRSTSQVPLRAGRESLFLSKGLISKPLVRLFYWQTISGNLHKRKQNKNKEAGETKKMTSNTVGSHPLYALRGSNPGPID